MNWRLGCKAFALSDGLAFSRPGRPSWAPLAAAFAGDLLAGRYWRTGRPTCVRASDGYAQTAGGVWTRFGPGELRLTDRGLLAPEPGATNLISNSVFAGAATGTPDTGPSLWSRNNAGGAGIEVTESVVAGARVRLLCTNARNFLRQDLSISAAAYCYSCVCDVLIARPLSTMFILGNWPVPATITWFLDGAATPNNTTVPIGKYALSIRIDAETAGPLSPYAGAGASGAATSDVIIDAPQLELGTRRSSPIPTTTAGPATRAADTVSITAPAGSYALHLITDDASETVLPGWTPATPLPLTLPQGRYIERYYGVAA